MQRLPALTLLIDGLHAAVQARTAAHEPARALVDQLTQALRSGAGTPAKLASRWLPTCDHLLSANAQAQGAAPDIRRLADLMLSLAPLLFWRRRVDDGTGSPHFTEGHANTHLVGPAGIEVRDDFVVGASLLAPGVVYPEHQHSPRETYLVLSAGDWYREDAGWYTPGLGGVVYHPAMLVHAMRATAEAPLLALWCLWP